MLCHVRAYYGEGQPETVLTAKGWRRERDGVQPLLFSDRVLAGLALARNIGTLIDKNLETVEIEFGTTGN